MARDRTGRSRTGDPDDGVPEWVTEPAKPPRRVPTCVRCGARVPGDRALYTICARCAVTELRELAAKTGTPNLTAIRREEVLPFLAKRLGMNIPTGQEPQPGGDPRVLRHAADMVRRGLSEPRALELATEYVASDRHPQPCAICEEIKP